MKCLYFELIKCGYDVVVFYMIGMGGMVFECLVVDGVFVCVMDFLLQEFVNVLYGLFVLLGEDCLIGVGCLGMLQMVVFGVLDIFDLVGWQEILVCFIDCFFYQYNWLIKNVVFNVEECVILVDVIVECFVGVIGFIEYFLFLYGIEEWDKFGEFVYDFEGFVVFIVVSKFVVEGCVQMIMFDCYINDIVFCEVVLVKFDIWVVEGIVVKGVF